MNLQSYIQKNPILVGGGAVILSIVIIGSFLLFAINNNTEDIKTETKKESVVEKKVAKKINATPTKKPVFIPTSTPTVIIFPTNTPTSTPAPTSTPGPTNTPAATPVPQDTEAPRTNIYHPQQNGVMSYKFDGRFCVILNPPSDNQSSYNDIGVSYKFDNDSWTEWRYSTAYLCKDTLPNGPHSIAVKSKDKAGNVENEQVLNFTVAIEGN
jgi:hypothetical protein